MKRFLILAAASIALILLWMHFESTKIKTAIETVAAKISREDGASKKDEFRRHCGKTGVLPSGGYCINPNRVYRGGNYMWDEELCRELEILFGYSSVGDFGAGLGHYGRCLLRHGENFVLSGNKKEVEDMKDSYKTKMEAAGLDGKPQVVRSWKGWDGALNIDEVSRGRIQALDLSKPVDLGEKFDWVLSLEVGEHIPREFEQVFLDNVVKHACKGVVLSWAVPHQAGHHHVNTRTNSYIEEEMESREMRRDEDAEKVLRMASTLNHFKNTLMIFKFAPARC